MSNATILVGDALTRLAELPSGSVRTCITSPPYFGLRDYKIDGQLGLEVTPADYVEAMRGVFAEVRRVLADDGTLWLNLGDSYANKPSWGRGDSSQLQGRKHSGAQIVAGRHDVDFDLPRKNLVGIPWRVAFALQGDGWILRQDIIWAKTNAMPESVTDRCTKSHEYLFLLTKSPQYYFDAKAIAESSVGGSRNRRSVWTIATTPFSGAHFAVMPESLVEPCVLAGSEPGDLVFDPFAGSGTVGVVALKHGRDFLGIELNSEYVALAEARIYDDGPIFNRVSNIY